MNKYLVSINDLPPDGKEFVVDDQDVWLEPLREFKMDCVITSPLKMRVLVLPADAGCLTRGNIEGAVTVPCSRCAENASVELASKFDEYEEIPENNQQKNDESHIIFERGAPMLNLADVAWEQFMLSMPPTPLCREECKGLCPRCGANLNLEECGCGRESGDPRMSALRGLKIQKK